MTDATLKQLQTAFPEAVHLDEPMSRHTTFKIGGPADALATPRTVAELQQIIAFCHEHELPIFVIGNGSNLLVRDRGLRAVVIKISAALSTVKLTEHGLEAEAGISLAALARAAVDASLGGLEFAAGIPGSLGGAVLMNAGAYGGEMKDVVERVWVLDYAGQMYEFNLAELEYGYRTSALQDKDIIVVRVALRLEEKDPDESQAIINELAARRRAKQPLHLPSAGSVFKRPPGYYAGALIQEAGLMGHQIGGAQVSTLHAGFIVNAGGATAADVENLIRHVQETVHDKSGVWLETEVRIVGE